MDAPIRLALLPINPTIGDLAHNAALIEREVRAVAGRADLVVLPELCICGYPPRDLLIEPSFVADCRAASDDLGRQLSREGPAVILGSPIDLGDRQVANELLAYAGGKLLCAYRKRLLPNYDVFDEQRYFIAGNAPAVITIAGVRVGLAVCEDLWQGEDARQTGRYDSDPLAATVEAGAELIVCPSASPFVIGKDRLHTELMRRQASRRGVPIASVNQLGANDDLIFDGHARVALPDGRVLDAPRYAGVRAVFSLDPTGAGDHGAGPIAAAIACEAAPPTRDTQRGLPTLQIPARTTGDPADGSREDLRELCMALALGVRDYVHKSGFTSVVLGLSGGIDSALTATIGVLGLGAAAVTGVRMPSAVSSEHSLTDAEDLAVRLGIRLATVPIAGVHEGFCAALDPGFGELQQPGLGALRPDITNENLQSRIRGAIVMAVSNRTGSLVLTTGNKSEYAVGYATLYGDMNGALAVLMDVPKTRVWALSRWINASWAELGFARPPIPANSISKPPSAELAEGQVDEDSLPPYDLLDRVIERRVDDGIGIDGIISELAGAQSSLSSRTIDADEIRRVCRLIQLNEYKRFQGAVGLKTSPRAFGPGRRMPVAMRRTTHGPDY